MANNFITIGEQRIKKSNIKSFGISSVEIPPSKEKEEPKNLLDMIPLVEIYKDFKKLFENDAQPAAKYRKYLYVTTYQGDNYRFYEENINIHETIKSLEQI